MLFQQSLIPPNLSFGYLLLLKAIRILEKSEVFVPAVIGLNKNYKSAQQQQYT